MNDLIENILYKLGLDRDEHNKEVRQLTLFLNDAKNMLSIYVNPIPEELLWICEEVAIERFRKIGVEGYSSESVDKIAINYDTDPMDKYMTHIQEYKNKTKKRVRMF